MMIKAFNSKKGTSDFIVTGITFYIIFFSLLVLFMSITGATKYITSDITSGELQPPQPPQDTGSFWDNLVLSLQYRVGQLDYFFRLFTLSANFQIFTGLVMTPFLLLLLMYILSMVRGN